MKAFIKQRSIYTFVCSLVLLSLVSCTDTIDHVAHWGYETDNGPNKWGTMDPDWILCAEGLSQSPIDLNESMETDLPEIKLVLLNDKEVDVLNQKGVISELDNGHTIQINAKTSEKMTVAEKSYSLIQFHFHEPSEHTVNGKHYPMEMHFVHQAEDGALAVVGVFIEEGSHNLGIETLWKHLGNEVGVAEQTKIPSDFSKAIITGDAHGIFHYDGSLTTPPCSEGVKWYIRKTPTQLSREQIDTFTKIYDHNNRPVQPINDRKLYFDENPSLTIKK